MNPTVSERTRLQAMHDAADAKGRDLLTQYVARHGVIGIIQPKLGKVSFGRHVQGMVSISMAAGCSDEVTTLWIDRTPHPSEGTSKVRITVTAPFDDDGGFTPAAACRIDAFMDRIRALQDRDRRIMDEGGDVALPRPWHYRAHAVLLAMSEGHGVSADELSAIDRYPQFGRKVIETPRGVKVRDVYRHREGGVDIHIEAEARGDRVIAKTATFEICGGRKIVLLETASNMDIVINGVDIPDTMLTTFRGRDLAEAVAHPILSRCKGVRIVSATKEKGGLRLRVASVLKPLAASPDGEA